jgi:uncharacterized repeat protein (TIGR02543 family)
VVFLVDTQLYAQWTPINYNVTYFLNGATGTTPTETTKVIDQKFYLAASTGLEKSGYTFGGWSDGTSTFNSGAEYTMGSANITFVAQWDPEVFTITYDINSGSGTPTRSSDVYKVGDAPIVLPDRGTLNRTGYTFGGWSETNSGTDIGTTYEPTKNTTLYAVWVPKTFTITYNPNGASGTPSVTSDSYTTGDVGKELPTVGTMVKTGHDFLGWATTASATAPNVNSPFTTPESITLYAVWSAKNYTITYVLDGGDSALPTESDKAYNSTFTLAAAATRPPSADHAWAFVAWNDGTNRLSIGHDLPRW